MKHCRNCKRQEYIKFCIATGTKFINKIQYKRWETFFSRSWEEEGSLYCKNGIGIIDVNERMSLEHFNKIVCPYACEQILEGQFG